MVDVLDDYDRVVDCRVDPGLPTEFLPDLPNSKSYLLLLLNAYAGRIDIHSNYGPVR